MMAIDTLKVAKRLREAGFDEAQAEALVDVVQEGGARSDLATKADLAADIAAVNARIDALAARLDARIDTLAATFDARIAEAKSEILSRMVQIIFSAVLVNILAMLGVMFAFAKLLGH